MPCRLRKRSRSADDVGSPGSFACRCTQALDLAFPKLPVTHKYFNHPELAIADLESRGRFYLRPPTNAFITDIPPRRKGRYLRFVCMSDTHSQTNRIQYKIPPGDVLIVAGDITQIGETPGVKKFDKWLASLPHKHKIVIAGNHELSFDLNIPESYIHMKANRRRLTKENHRMSRDPRSYLKSCIYLEDECVVVDGVSIWGSPWQPWFHDWAFNLERGEPCAAKWRKIPAFVDVLVTHGPPAGVLDFCVNGNRAGCVDLLMQVTNRIRPRFHVFGHIHEDYGCESNGFTTFVNASTCNKCYVPVNLPVVFDVPKPTCCDDAINRIQPRKG